MELKLSKLPERTPIKVSINLPPDVHEALADYAAAYVTAYGQDEPVSELIPAMLKAFLESDRAFVRSRQQRGPR